jgi:hypothetical protein
MILNFDSEDSEYNIDLIESLQYGNRKPLKYLESTRIELDHVIDEAGVGRFFDYVVWKLGCKSSVYR